MTLADIDNMSTEGKHARRPAPDPRITLKINTFGLSPRARFAQPDRVRRNPKLESLRPDELYNGLRGALCAARIELGDACPDDVKVAFRNALWSAFELTRRLLSHLGVDAAEEPHDPPQPPVEMAVDDGQTFLAVAHRGQDGRVTAIVPSMPGCQASGQNTEAALANVRRAARRWVDEHGGELPGGEPTELHELRL